MKTTFKEKVLEVVRNIKKGQTLSYKEVAEKAGNKNASRAVGNIMAKNNDKSIPCHRVIRSDGELGEYNRLLGKSKKELLEYENPVKIV